MLELLTEEEIKKSINKGASYIRKCSDPDVDSDGIKRNIDHKDSVELDKACVSKGFAPPLLTAHQYIIDQEKSELSSDELNDVSRMLVKFSILENKQILFSCLSKFSIYLSKIIKSGICLKFPIMSLSIIFACIL